MSNANASNGGGKAPPNGPSKNPGKESGGGRGNNPPKK